MVIVIDAIVGDLIIIEFKSVGKLLSVHEAQLLSYLKLSGKNVGLLINCNVPVLKDGVKSIVNNLIEPQRLSVSAVCI